MRDVQALLTDYARYHRDPRNIATHLLGVPTIVVAVGVLLAHPMIPVNGRSAGFFLTPAWALWLAATLWYCSRGRSGQWAVVVATALSTALMFWVSHHLALLAGRDWLLWGAALFVAGWILQFVGHYFEGRKPAFADDLVGLLVGPMFVVAEGVFALGLAKKVHEGIVRDAGPVRLRDLSVPRSQQG